MDDSVSSDSSGFIRSRVVQVHPTLRCNLTCAHCYSSSGPAASARIDPATLIERLQSLREEGFEVVSFSGGEPLVYDGIVEVAQEATRLGYRVTMITNGLLVARGRMKPLMDLLWRVGVSLDGAEVLHDQMRGAGTFARTTKALDYLRANGSTFGVAHCLTRASMADLPWIAEYCANHGASLLQIHPLVKLGRGLTQNHELDPTDCARAFLLAEVLKVQYGDDLQIQLDLVPRERVLAHRLNYRVLRCREHAQPRLPLSDLVNPVVLDERGTLWPLAYGMHGSQKIATGDTASWRTEVEDYCVSWADAFRNLLLSGLQGLADAGHGFVDWYAYLAAHSHRQGLRPNGSPRARSLSQTMPP